MSRHMLMPLKKHTLIDEGDKPTLCFKYLKPIMQLVKEMVILKSTCCTAIDEEGDKPIFTKYV